ncbi:transposase [Massilia sp. S19_KUP03_FR1]|uniref:transposase n=1 Tax=Massilia sp. S19_KUP03_FR1 TaxID=3025503 RepID=UPI003FA5B12A
MATRKRKTFDPSLKLEVVRMITEQGQSIRNVSESMDIGQTAIRRWLAQGGRRAEWPARYR